MMRNTLFVILFIVSILTLPQRTSAQGLTPKSPKVLESVDRATAYIVANVATETRVGGKALAAMALFKAGAEAEHPVVQHAVDAIRKSIDAQGKVTMNDHIYSVALSLLLLAELDPQKYRREIAALGQFLVANQRTEGPWTYINHTYSQRGGDMSMSQYAILAIWVMTQCGFDVPSDTIDRFCRWMIAAQNSDGAFAYMTKVSPDYRNATWETDSFTISMGTAGMASLYVCCDLAGYGIRHVEPSTTPALPTAFSEIKQEEKRPTARKVSTSKESFYSAQTKGNRWLDHRFQPIAPDARFFYYYVYSLERYSAFRELSEQKFPDSPSWYNQMATILFEKQKTDGSWSSNDSEVGTVVDTSYAVLFLLRSTRRSFEKWRPPTPFDGGDLIGGRGLPKLTDRVQVKDGQVVSLSEIKSGAKLIEQLESMNELDETILESIASLSSSEIESVLQSKQAKIKQLIGHPSAEQRLSAVRLLAMSGNVTNVAVLIYALSDPDPVVAEAALKGIHRLARVVNPKETWPMENDGMRRSPDQLNVERRKIIDRWKTWYYSIDPNVDWKFDF